MDGLKHRGVARRSSWFSYLLFVCLSWQLLVVVHAENRTTSAQMQGDGAFLASLSQETAALLQRRSVLAAPNESALSPSQASALDKCMGVFLTYGFKSPPVKIHPYNDSNQPYSFESLVTLTNFGYKELQFWELSIDFQYDEVIATAGDVLFLNGQIPPGLETTNDTRLVGVTTPNLLTSIDTAQNQDLISTEFNITGTEFGVDSSGFPLPKNLTLVNVGYSCASINSDLPSELWVCCTENQTAIDSVTSEGDFLPRQSGDIIISYDVTTASTTTYTALVSIVMNDPIGRMDFWNVTWQWTGGEVINTMQGGQVLGGNDQDLCVYGVAAVAYPGQPFKDFMSCSPKPVVIDLQPSASTDPSLAIPYCCRNGTLLPDLIDPSQSRSDFQMEVWKQPPHNILDDITPPVNWKIGDGEGDGYQCTQPSRVSPAEITPDALHSSSSVASWQVTCNATQAVKKCCVSFSAFYNDSVVPCPTCSCGCSKPVLPWNGETCNPSIEALMIPYYGVLLPPSNRTLLSQELARQDHYAIPQAGYPLPCPDNCGVAINWHVYSDYTNGWSARMTIFNWETQTVVNWSAAIQMPEAMPGFQEVYSFNGTLVPDVNEFNNTLFVQGHQNYNNFYLDGKNSLDNPGKLQSILSFDKRKTPGINVPGGDGFPKTVWFNGEECQLPDFRPAGDGSRLLPTFQFAIVMSVTMFLLAGEKAIRFL